MAVSVDLQSITSAKHRAYDDFEVVSVLEDKGSQVTLYFGAESGARAVADAINAAVAGAK